MMYGPASEERRSNYGDLEARAYGGDCPSIDGVGRTDQWVMNLDKIYRETCGQPACKQNVLFVD